jgi:acylphosphatase
MEFRGQLPGFARASGAADRLTVFYMPTQRLRITGLVQGVGFRYALRSEARRLGLSGWVRNRSDGSVEALARGAPEALDALAGWARRGPPAARVDDVRVEAADEAEALASGFELRPTF